MARDEKLMVRLSGAVKEDFQGMADERGITMSALAAFILGDWVRQQKMVAVQIMNQLDKLSPAFAKAIMDEEEGR